MKDENVTFEDNLDGIFSVEEKKNDNILQKVFIISIIVIPILILTHAFL